MKIIKYISISLFIFLIDQWVKYSIIHSIAPNKTVKFIPGILDLSNIHNYGAAWNTFEGDRVLFICISIFAIIIMLLLIIYNKKDYLFSISISIMLGGTLGNFVDRLHWGYVVDMFTVKFINFPIFNVSDCALTLGAILLIISLFVGDNVDENNKNN